MSRDDVFEEVRQVLIDGKCNATEARAQMDAYKKDGFKPFSLAEKFPIVTGEITMLELWLVLHSSKS